MANRNAPQVHAASLQELEDLAEIIKKVQTAGEYTTELYIAGGSLEIRSGHDLTVGRIDIWEDGESYTFTPQDLRS